MQIRVVKLPRKGKSYVCIGEDAEFLSGVTKAQTLLALQLQDALCVLQL